MRLKKNRFTLLPLSAFVLLAANIAAAKNYTLQPMIGVSTRWDSNYFYDPADESAVSTWLVQPGFKFDYQAARTRAEFGATLDGTMYSGEDDRLDSFVGWTAGLDLSSRPAQFRRLTLGLRDMLMHTRNPELFGDLRKSTRRELYTINTLNPYAEYDLDRFRTSLEYENTVVRYDEDFSEDSMLHRWSTKALYKMNRTFEFGPRIKMEAMSYEGDMDDYQGVDLGGVLTRNGKFVDLQGSIGYHKRELDDADDSGLDEMSWQLALQSQRTGFRKTKFSLSLLGDISDSLTADGYYSTMQIKGSVERKVFKHLELGLNVLYAWDDYELTGREDDIWKICATAGYAITSWLELKLEIARQERDSTIDVNDYDNTSCMVKLNYIP